MRTLWLIAPALLGLTTFAGCGGTSGPVQAGPVQLTEAEVQELRDEISELKKELRQMMEATK